jgi:hypothetical protein
VETAKLLLSQHPIALVLDSGEVQGIIDLAKIG